MNRNYLQLEGDFRHLDQRKCNLGWNFQSKVAVYYYIISPITVIVPENIKHNHTTGECTYQAIMYKSPSILVLGNIIHQPNSITSLNKGIQAVKLLPVLAHHSPNHVSNWHHAFHTLVVDDGYVPDSVICPPSTHSPGYIKEMEQRYTCTAAVIKCIAIPVISCIARKTLVSGVTVISLFCNHKLKEFVIAIRSSNILCGYWCRWREVKQIIDVPVQIKATLSKSVKSTYKYPYAYIRSRCRKPHEEHLISIIQHVTSRKQTG